MITTSLAIPMIGVSSLAMILFIGLGFLPRPSRATALWSAAFAISTIGAYVWLVQNYVYPEELRALGSALVVGPMPLLWSGVRAYRGQRRVYLPVSILVLVASPALLLTAVALDFYVLAFRLVFVGMSVFAALIVVELVRLGPQMRDEAIPLLAVSGAYVVFAAIATINGVLQVVDGPLTGDSLEFTRNLNMVGANVYIMCALVTTLLLTTRTADTASSPHGGFEHTARTRLSRARAAEDEWWALLDIRLDDPDEIRLASSTAAFNAVCERFAEDVDAVLPPDADIERLTPTRFVTLVPRSQGGVRELLSELLQRVTKNEEPSNSLPVRPTASVGWAPVSAVGYEYDALVAAASEAAVRAAQKGGDRWERIHGAGE
jgi:GGDEF domain-containing protein